MISTVYLQAKKSDILKVKATLFFDGQSKPNEKNLELQINCKKKELTWKDFYKTCLKNNKHYQETLYATPFKGTKMMIETPAANRLVSRYFKK